MISIFFACAKVLFLMALAPLLSWFIKKMKAISQNRVGPSPVQVYTDLWKLFHKDMVISEAASWIFHAMPFVLFASVLSAASLTPVSGAVSLFGFTGDVIVFVYLLALGRFFLTLAALDTGTTFGGMGSSREMTLSSLAEPALLLSFFSLSFRTQSLSLDGIVSYFSWQSPIQILFFTSLAFGALLIVTIAESGRIPMDNPATHLELTMIHEAMILEYSGRYLALIEWSHQIKQIIFLTLLANLFFPWNFSGMSGFAAFGVGIGLYLLKIFFLAFVIGWIEIHSAKLRLFRAPDLLAVAFVLAVLSLLGQLIIGRGV
ncbi:MAG TPA: NADH-quinone oxidoreductase subunit H [Candidatus Omnitrophota bacterium]|nr:NADH-quinone oxidoreductase subunit H [Candidatus Omnitrophota bacterium]